MAQMVADVLVDVLEQIGVRQIFGLIGDSLNPLGDAVRRSTIEWIGVRHEEGAALAAAGQAKLTGRLGVCAGTTGPGTMHRSLPFPATCRAGCAGSTMSRRLSRICSSAMSASIPKPFPPRRRRRQSFIRRSRLPTRAAALRI